MTREARARERTDAEHRHLGARKRNEEAAQQAARATDRDVREQARTLVGEAYVDLFHAERKVQTATLLHADRCYQEDGLP